MPNTLKEIAYEGPLKNVKEHFSLGLSEIVNLINFQKKLRKQGESIAVLLQLTKLLISAIFQMICYVANLNSRKKNEQKLQIVKI